MSGKQKIQVAVRVRTNEKSSSVLRPPPSRNGRQKLPSLDTPIDAVCVFRSKDIEKTVTIKDFYTPSGYSFGQTKNQAVQAKEKDFSFDHIFMNDDTQEKLYQCCVEPIITKCLKGFNGCVFCYGQTASGKTYTMSGPNVTPLLPLSSSKITTENGILIRAIHQIVSHINRNKKRDTAVDLFEQTISADDVEDDVEYDMKCSYMEIYQEQLIDLLVDPSESCSELKIRNNTESIIEGDLYVQGLTEKTVFTAEDFVKILSIGTKRRTVGETNMNEASSRSHAILTVVINQISTRSNNLTKRSKIHFIDLAGSERVDSTGATGTRLKEGAKINQSLLSLGNVVNAITEKSKHIPFRDSKLTYLLSDSLGGNSITIMIACVHPSIKNHDETLSTLRFAERVKRVKNNARINVDPKLLRILDLETEINDLKTRLNAGCDCGITGISPVIIKSSIGTMTDIEIKLKWWKKVLMFLKITPVAKTYPTYS